MFTASTAREVPATTTGWLLSLLLDASLRGLAILVVAMLMSRLLRNRSAAVQHLLWLFAMAGLLLTPLLAGVLPAWRILPNVESFLASAADAPPQPDASKAGSQRSAPAQHDSSAAQTSRSESAPAASTPAGAAQSPAAIPLPADAAPSAPWTVATFAAAAVLIWGSVAASLTVAFCLGALESLADRPQRAAGYVGSIGQTTV